MADTTVETTKKLFQKGIDIYKEALASVIQEAPNEELLEYETYVKEPEFKMFYAIKQQISDQHRDIKDQVPDSGKMDHPNQIRLDAETIRSRLKENPELLKKLSLSETHRTRIAETLFANTAYKKIVSAFSVILKQQPHLITNSGMWELAIKDASTSNIGGGIMNFRVEMDIVTKALEEDEITYNKVAEYIKLFRTERTVEGSFIENGDLIGIWSDLITNIKKLAKILRARTP